MECKIVYGSKFKDVERKIEKVYKEGFRYMGQFTVLSHKGDLLIVQPMLKLPVPTLSKVTPGRP